MSRNLDDLDSRFRPLAEELLRECAKVGIHLLVVTTSRTLAEQTEAVKHGVSWTMKSKHLPQPPEGKSQAIDVVPHVLTTVKGWGPGDPLWARVGLIGQGLGLKWGVWIGGLHKDLGHFEYVPPKENIT